MAALGTTLPVAALRRFVSPVEGAALCELCGGAVAAEGHAHVLDGLEAGPGRLRCVCEACRIVFDHPGAGGGDRRTVPAAVWSDPAHDPAAFAALAAPVSVVYVVAGRRGVVASYPGPAGIATATVEEEVWAGIRRRSALAATVEPDVGAVLLIAEEAWRVGVDVCHHLTASLRDRWEGFDGGPPAAAVLARTRAELVRRAVPLPAGGADR